MPNDATRPAPFSPLALGAAAALGALVIDQASKYWLLRVFDIEARQPIRLTPFLDVVLSWNHGLSYSLLAAEGPLTRFGLLALQLSIIMVICLWLRRARAPLTALALGLIIGGALGNALDRLLRGAVADFFFLHTTLPVGPLANYVFNIADAAITIGVLLLVFEGFASKTPKNSS
ncbi:MAG TPA: signal peptidase II [Methylocystis sp.]|nr:signal peptidase II [Methylocystis sp.]